MAPTVETQHLGGGSGDVNGMRSTMRKDAPSPSVETPPSPPATETDTEDPETPPPHPPATAQQQQLGGRPETTRIDTSVGDARDHGFSPVTSPPYWVHHGYSNHARTTSVTSVESIPTGGITLQDNENSSIDDRNGACWAKSVGVSDYVVVNGSATNIGAFVVWNIRVETLTGSFMNIRKRYSEFDDFRWRLIRTFPNFEAAVPELPPKSLISKFRPRFLEKRRAGLQYFLNCIMLNPEFSGSPVLKEFLFS